MIVTKEVSVKISKRNIKHFKDNGFDVNLKDVISINPSYLTKGSHKKILAKCDNCNIEKSMEYRSYLKFTQKGGYYVCKKCNNIKVKETNLRKYGVVCNSQLPEWKEMVREKWENKTEEELLEIKNKHIKTNNERYGVDFYTRTNEYSERSKLSCLDRYRVENVSQFDEFKKKRKDTKNERFGVENNSQLPEWKEMVREKWENKTEEELLEIKNKHIKTNNERYGVDFYTQTGEFLIKSRKTSNEKYGYNSPNQNPDIHRKQQMSGFKLKKYKDLTYQGSYELDFLEKFYNKVKILDGLSVEYIFESKDRVYHSDFYLPDYNLIVEIKSKYTFERYLKKNLRKHRYCKNNGYNFLFIIDKDYNKLREILNFN